MQATASTTSVTPVISANAQSAQQPPPSTPSNKPPTVSTRPTFNPKAPNYYEDLKANGFINAAQLKAVRFGNKDDLKKGDESAKAIAVAASIESFDKEQAAHRACGSLSGQRARDRLLKKNFIQRGYEFVKNSAKNHNCLIISILQHLTGDYESSHDEKAANYRGRLNKHLKSNLNAEQKKKFLHNDLLHVDHLGWLLEEMAKDELLNKKRPTVEIWSADANGEPFTFPIGEGPDKFIIFHGADHFEAVRLDASKGAKPDTKSTGKKPEPKIEVEKLSGAVFKSAASLLTEADTMARGALDEAFEIESDL